jgi:hypothetical protein
MAPGFSKKPIITLIKTFSSKPKNPNCLKKLAPLSKPAQ